MRFFLAAACGLSVLFLLPATAPAYKGYHWPLDLPPVVTGSFGEYRSARFHAGIDLRTGGDGVPIRAARDGYVSRVRCSAFGYGKAVYINFDDGNSGIYAHLDDYREDLAAFVRETQHRNQQYELDEYLTEDRFPVRRGEVIAFSGTTGTSAPHLHFELRDAENRPINPREVGIRWQDSRPPAINRLLITPDAPSSTLNGDYLPLIVPIDRSGGAYQAPGVYLQGRANIAVDVIDHNAAYRHGPHEMVLESNGQELFRMRHDILAYERLRAGAVAWTPYALSEGRFLGLWRWPGNDSESYSLSESEGWIEMDRDPLKPRLRVWDTQRNESAATLSFLPETGDSVPQSLAESPGPGVVDLEWHGLYWTVLVRFPGPEGTYPRLSAEPAVGFEPGDFVRVGSGAFRSAFKLHGNGLYQIAVQHPRVDASPVAVAALQQGVAQRVGLGHATIDAPADAAFGVLYAQADRVGQPSGEGLRIVGDPVLIEPVAAPLKESVRIGIPLPTESPAGLALYRWRGGFSYLGGERSDGMLWAATNQWGVFVLGEDIAPPTIAFETPPENYRAQTARPHIRANIRDLGSGIDSYELRCGDQWLLAEYTPRKHEVRWLRDADLPSGPQEITLRVTDKAGNVTEERQSVIIP